MSNIKFRRFLPLQIYQIMMLAASSFIISVNAFETCRIKEHSPINSVVCSVNHHIINDRNQNLYLFTYKNIFKINSINQLVVINSIDRELLNPTSCVPGPEDTINPYCRLTVEVVNKTKSIDFQIFQLPVDIEDINDNSPTFDKLSYNIEIDENVPSGHIQQLPVARDSDYGLNSEIFYSLEGNDKAYFSLTHLKNSKPTLKTTKSFDREERDRYELIMIATDNGNPKRTGEIKLFIKIRDLNDHAPEFDIPKNFIIPVKEDTVEGSKICDIKVTDKDDETLINVLLNTNSDSEVKKHFQVSASSGLTLISRLDYESSNRKFTIPIIAIDNGVPNLTTSATIIINVEDINDNYPKITIDTLSDSNSNFKLMENQPKQTFVAMVSVSDADMNMNGVVDCNIVEPGNKQNFELVANYFNSFSNQKRNYKIVTLQVFDREVIAHYRVSVLCKDQGLPSLSSQETITIWIEDVNDNPPTFSKLFYQDRIKENLMPGVPIFTLLATDPDVGKNAKIIYQIQLPYQNIVSILNPSSGVVTNLVSFDREVNKSIVFKAYAIDENNPLLNSSVEVTLEIEDQNDCVPIFLSNSYNFKIKEGHNGWVGKVEAYDNDSNSNGEITFAFTGFSHNNLWILRSDGNIFSERGSGLDREIQNVYHLTVEAKDRGIPSRSSSVIVQITLEDINDNAPKFIQPSDSRYAVTITESMGPGSVVTKVTATDEDENENAKVTYIISNNKYFVIDDQNGEITINKSLDYSDQMPRRLIIMARDNGTPPLTSTLYLSLTFQQEIEEKEKAITHFNPDHERNYQNARKRTTNDIYDGLKWNSKEVLISLTVGSVMLIISCGGLLLIYIWYQSKSSAGYVKRSDAEIAMTEGTISSPIEDESEESSCIQWPRIYSKNKAKGFVKKTDCSSIPQRKQDIVSQPHNKQQREEKNEEGNNPKLANYPFIWKYDSKFNDLYPFSDSNESNLLFKSNSTMSINVYEPPLKQLKPKSPIINIHTHSTVPTQSYNDAPLTNLIYNHSKYETTTSQKDRTHMAATKANYPAPCFAIPNPKINNSFV